MQIETLYATNYEELEYIVNKFIIDKIIHDVKYQNFGIYWQAYIFYDDIIENKEDI
ncbi:MAG: hypothetical protein K2L10_04240 [Ruminococcus sp.]|nr:hypothetical protein [Ruminococcus sp.]